MSDNVRRDNRRGAAQIPADNSAVRAAGRRAGLFHRCGWGRWRGGDGAAGPGPGAGGVCALGHRRQRRGAAGGGLVPLCRRQTALCRLGWGGRGRHGRGGAAAELGSAADGAGDNPGLFLLRRLHHLRPLSAGPDPLSGICGGAGGAPAEDRGPGAPDQSGETGAAFTT